jgi:hypothetical protein
LSSFDSSSGNAHQLYAQNIDFSLINYSKIRCDWRFNAIRLFESCSRDTQFLSIPYAVDFINVQDYKSSKTYWNEKHRCAFPEDDPKKVQTYGFINCKILYIILLCILLILSDIISN